MAGTLAGVAALPNRCTVLRSCQRTHSTCLHPLADVLKYYGCELGAQTNYESKSGVCIVNGAHDNQKLGEILEGFIKKYVQCYSCGNPETQIKIKKENISLKCKVRRRGPGGRDSWRMSAWVPLCPEVQLCGRAQGWLCGVQGALFDCWACRRSDT